MGKTGYKRASRAAHWDQPVASNSHHISWDVGPGSGRRANYAGCKQVEARREAQMDKWGDKAWCLDPLCGCGHTALYKYMSVGWCRKCWESRGKAEMAALKQKR